jgi:hypothetical protein
MFMAAASVASLVIIKPLIVLGLPFGEDDMREVKRAKKLDHFDGALTSQQREDALEGDAKAAYLAVPV